MRLQVLVDGEPFPIVPHNYSTEHSYDEGSDGLHAWTARKPIHTKTLCEEAGLDINISNQDAAAAYCKIIDTYLAGRIKHDDMSRELKLVHKRRGRFHFKVEIAR